MDGLDDGYGGRSGRELPSRCDPMDVGLKEVRYLLIHAPISIGLVFLELPGVTPVVPDVSRPDWGAVHHLEVIVASLPVDIDAGLGEERHDPLPAVGLRELPREGHPFVELPDDLHKVLRPHLVHDLVMDGQDVPAAILPAEGPELLVDEAHGVLDDVRRSRLDGVVDGAALGLSLDAADRGVDPGDRELPAEGSEHALVLPRVALLVIDVAHQNRDVVLQVLHVPSGILDGAADVPLYGASAAAVDEREIAPLTSVALVLVDVGLTE
ncbi:MAG: hypothetical protein BWY99_02543 [Synergistetes bacterium ADurb.BinA166]|nr:MAG: hypothetical protein BWY99_02543 [Synergistetes bacterium ADurb.BinA166]